MNASFEQAHIRYTLRGDYYLSELALPAENQKNIGLWGQRRMQYLKRYRRLMYSNLLTSGKLNEHLADTDSQAEEMFFRLVKQAAEREGISEQLKAENPMEWVRQMNSIRSRATEAVNTELIFN